MTTDYTSEDIQVLTDREHVRLRTYMYMGNMSEMEFTLPDFTTGKLNIYTASFIPAVYTAVGEILDNAVDEFSEITKANKKLEITYDSNTDWYKVVDNGRGVPITKHTTGKYTPEVVFGSLRSGRNFKDNKTKGVKGMNGVGSAVTNFTSTEFSVEVHRDKQCYIQTFKDGAKEVSTPSITTYTKRDTGTIIKFQLDKSVYENIKIPERVIQNRAHHIALMNPGVSVVYNDTTYKYQGGFNEVVNKLGYPVTSFNIDTERVTGTIYVLTDISLVANSYCFVWVNSTLVMDGGLCNTQIINALASKTASHLSPQAKKQKGNITASSVKTGFIILANLKVSDPEYDSQAKIRFQGPSLRKEITTCFDENWLQFVKTHNVWLTKVLNDAIQNNKTTEASQAIKQLEDRIKRQRRPEALIEATGKDRKKCKILITEGLSARASIQEARDPSTIAAFAMSGKFNNVYDSSVAEVLKMGKLTDLFAAINLVPGKPLDRNNLRYGQIVISVDADYDGQDIFCNFINLFFKFWPELLDPNCPPIIHKLVVPNVVVSKGDKRIHFKTRQDYEKQSKKYSTWDVEYMKGLGSMTIDDWKMVLSSDEYLIPVVSDEQMKDTMELLFSSNADKRKEWLEQ